MDQSAMDNEEKSLLDAVFSSMGDGVYYTDGERRILRWNRAAEELSGYHEDEVLGRPCSEILNHTSKCGKELCTEGCPLVKVMEGDTSVFVEEVWLRRKDGKRVPVEVNCTTVRDEGGNLLGMVEIFRDRTKQWDLARLREEFLAAMTHDLKSPMSAIIGFTDLLADPRLGEIPEAKMEFVRMIQHSSTMVLAMISNILDSARIEAGQMLYAFDTFLLNEVLDELGKVFMPLTSKGGIAFDFQCPPSTWVYADYGKILQVFHNLISNALRYTSEGGRISIDVTDRGDNVGVAVADTGKGIAREFHDRIFQKYGQAKGERRGSGLGLFIVKNILEGHGSVITLESDTGMGTRFLFSLKKGSPPPEVPSRQGSLMLVGSESGSIRLVRLLLQKEGHEVEVFTRGAEALARLEKRLCDVILLHRPLSDMREEDFAYQVKSRPMLGDIPIILLSALRLKEWEGRFDLIVPLPVTKQILRKALAGLLDTRRCREASSPSQQTP
ncbi:MAG: ATP-binding protein [Candidatus Eremiobacteraeota bacterium]|nr:ATP-binding protein [Candidatus Eremiobacteraeota bacterium]